MEEMLAYINVACTIAEFLAVLLFHLLSRLAKERARLKKEEAEGRMQPDAEIVKRLQDMFSLQVPVPLCHLFEQMNTSDTLPLGKRALTMPFRHMRRNNKFGPIYASLYSISAILYFGQACVYRVT